MKILTDKKVVLNLVGLDGNAFALMGAFRQAARRQGIAKDQIDAVIAECQTGDYNHLLQTLIAHTESAGDSED